MLKTKEKIYIYNRKRIIYTKDNKSYFKYNSKYLLLNNDDDLYTNAKNIVYKYIGGNPVDPIEDVFPVNEGENALLEDSEKKKEDEDNKKKCEDFYKVFSEVIKNKIQNIIKNKDKYILYITEINSNYTKEIEKSEGTKEGTKEETEEETKEEKKKKKKIINIYFIENLFRKKIFYI